MALYHHVKDKAALAALLVEVPRPWNPLGCTKFVQPLFKLLKELDQFGGASRDRTDDLIVANDALSQLSYSPTATGNYSHRF